VEVVIDGMLFCWIGFICLGVLRLIIWNAGRIIRAEISSEGDIAAKFPEEGGGGWCGWGSEGGQCGVRREVVTKDVAYWAGV